MSSVTSRSAVVSPLLAFQVHTLLLLYISSKNTPKFPSKEYALSSSTVVLQPAT